MNGRLVLREEILEKINTNKQLKEKVATALDISVHSLYRLLYANDPKLTQAAVLKVLREHLGVSKDKDLLAEIKIQAVA